MASAAGSPATAPDISIHSLPEAVLRWATLDAADVLGSRAHPRSTRAVALEYTAPTSIGSLHRPTEAAHAEAEAVAARRLATKRKKSPPSASASGRAAGARKDGCASASRRRSSECRCFCAASRWAARAYSNFRSRALRLARLLGLTDDSLEEVDSLLDTLPSSTPDVDPISRAAQSTTSGAEGGKVALQNAFVRYHRFMYGQGLLPLSRWGEGRGSKSFDEATPSRKGFIQFISEQAPRLLRANSVCLGWDSTYYVERLAPQCDITQAWSFRFVDHGGKRVHADVDAEARTVRADLRSALDRALLGQLYEKFDAVFCNQVFEHVSDPFSAAASLWSLLAPNGLVFWTAPFAEIYHRVPEDYFRYSCQGAKHVFTSAGFEVAVMNKIGDGLMATGWLMGFGTGDFTAEHLQRRLVNNVTNRTKVALDLRERVYISCALVLRKPASGAPAPVAPNYDD